MEVKQFKYRQKKITLKEKIVNYLQKHSFIETLLIIITYLVVGYFIDSQDICLIHSDIPYLIIILAIVTLFHGFENGILAISIIAAVMFFTYELFPYTEFLILLMMTLIYSQFHYYWTSKIKEAKVDADFKSVKLNELSRAFYSLKISHDQLEKNYVIKPMSIRNSLDSILTYHQQVLRDDTIFDKKAASFSKFLNLLQKSFGVQSAFILYHKDPNTTFTSTDDLKAVYGEYTDKFPMKEIMENILVTKSLNRKMPVFISDEQGEPTLRNELDNKFIAAIPAIYEDQIIAMLVIEKMPFMAFERENLTSIAILLEYFSMELQKSLRYQFDPLIEFIDDTPFKYEVTRLTQLHNKFKVDSTFIVLKMYDELESLKLKDKIRKMLRSLDMISYYKHDGFYYLILLFPLQDKAAAEGFLGRLERSVTKEDGEYYETIINISRIDLLHNLIFKPNAKEVKA